MESVESNFPNAHWCWALKQCSVRCTQTALYCRGEVVFFKSLLKKYLALTGGQQDWTTLDLSTLAYFLCVPPDIADASQLWTLKEAEWLLLQLAQGLQRAPKSSSFALPQKSHWRTMRHVWVFSLVRISLLPFISFAKGKREAEEKQGDQVQWFPSLWVFFSSCGNARENIGTTGREHLVLDSYSFWDFYIAVCRVSVPSHLGFAVLCEQMSKQTLGQMVQVCPTKPQEPQVAPGLGTDFPVDSGEWKFTPEVIQTPDGLTCLLEMPHSIQRE